MNPAERIKEWRKKHPEAVRQHRDKNRFGGNRDKALKRDKHRCVMCGMTQDQHMDRWKRSLTVDHIDGNGRYTPKEQRNNDLSNLQTLCLSCHGAKDVRRRKWRAVCK